MKKQKLKLGLQKSRISNLQTLNTVKGGNGSDLSACIKCVDTSVHTENEDECNESANCPGSGGYLCGGSARLNCSIPTNPETPC
ncbi:hypothetical protein H2O64_23055 [Kordia sp. YSTF-M3]|uniref:Natural product n=1 Tax=Kordia aestuariivivens TaxID=2759037 RepID=A0ABR7QG54_9FLAO|nr:hypothetical protein [Kordia aestuariivivens]MBC8757565.1 hypothetical protein [Kordia aestuariivivens]